MAGESKVKRRVRFLITSVTTLFAMSLLPLYIVPTMTRMQMSTGGDIINWGIGLVSLYDYLSDYEYMSPETSPRLWLIVNIALAIFYSSLITIIIELLLARGRARKINER